METSDGEKGSSQLPSCDRVENLIDGRYRTKDDTRLWWTGYSPGSPVQLRFHMHSRQRIAMLRIWVCLSFLLIQFSLADRLQSRQPRSSP